MLCVGSKLYFVHPHGVLQLPGSGLGCVCGCDLSREKARILKGLILCRRLNGRGVVSSRVALLLRSAETLPWALRQQWHSPAVVKSAVPLDYMGSVLLCLCVGGVVDMCVCE